MLVLYVFNRDTMLYTSYDQLILVNVAPGECCVVETSACKKINSATCLKSVSLIHLLFIIL